MLLLQGVPLAEAERYGRFLNYPEGHEQVWGRYQNAGVVPADVEYEVVPRGRVLFDTVAGLFYLYADVCILRQKELTYDICHRLGLPEATKMASDEHYRCGLCLAALR